MSVHASLSTFWKKFNDASSLLPLAVSLAFFSSAYGYSKCKRGLEFHKWLRIHNVHNGMAIVLGATSLYLQNEEIFRERIPILWSVGYFVVDLFDCMYRMDVQYTFHAAVCLTLGCANYCSPLLQQLRMNSKATMCELSTPFMHWAKLTRKPIHFALFGMVFTLCRIVWLPVMMKQLRNAGLPWSDVRLLGMIAFYCLNLYWYWKIIAILFAGSSKQQEEMVKKEE